MVDAAAELDNLAPIFVSDWGKLSTAAADMTGGDWALTQQDLDSVSTSIEQGAAQTAYESLMPVAYTTYQLCPTQSDPKPQNAADWTNDNPLDSAPFAGIPDAGQILLAIGVSPLGPVGALYAMQAPASEDLAHLPEPSLNPPSSLVTPLFQSVTQSGGIGLFAPYFWVRYMLPPDTVLTDENATPC